MTRNHLGKIALIILSLAAAEGLYRAFWTLRLPARSKTDNVFELYVVGESTAAGYPYESLAPAEVVFRQFGGRLTGREIQVFTLARNGQSIYPQRVALERALRGRNRRNPGAVLIYSGHNDATAERGLSVFERLKQRWLYRSALLNDLIYHAEKSALLPRFRTLDTWQYNLRRVVELSLASGLQPVLATCVSNLSDIDPFLPYNCCAISPKETTAILQRGQELELKRRYSAALAYYSKQAALHPEMSHYLTYRKGKCHQALGQYREAKRLFESVVDFVKFDNFGRATRRHNDYIRALAKQYSVALADVTLAFEENSPHSLLGDALFIDGQHPNAAGYAILGAAFTHSIAEAFKEPPREPLFNLTEFWRTAQNRTRQQARALLASGNWLFTVACYHAYPEVRLKKAQRRFQSAAALIPEDLPAWLGLGLADAAMRSNILADEKHVNALTPFFYVSESLPEGKLSEALNMLEASGTPESLLNAIRTKKDAPWADYRQQEMHRQLQFDAHAYTAF